MRNAILTVFLLPFLFSSCVKEFSMDAHERPVVAVECVLTDAPEQTLRLAFTKSADAAEAPQLKQAEAVLIDLTENTTVGTFVKQDIGIWTLEYAAVCEHKYRLEIQVPGHELIYAEQTMPQACDVFSRFHNIVSSMTAPISASYYYRGTMYSNPGDTMWVYAMSYNPETGRREAVTELCTDAPYVDDFNFTGSYYKPPSSDYDVNGEPREGCELYPNLRDYPLHRYALRFKMPSSDAHAVSFSGSFSGNFQKAPGLAEGLQAPAENEGAIFFCKVSEDYEKYLKEIVLLMGLDNSSNLADMFMRDNLHSNINGGIGIFGAKSEQIHPWVYGYWKEGELCFP